MFLAVVLLRLKAWLAWRVKFWKASRVSLRRVADRPVYYKGIHVGWLVREPGSRTPWDSDFTDPIDPPF